MTLPLQQSTELPHAAVTGAHDRVGKLGGATGLVGEPPGVGPPIGCAFGVEATGPGTDNGVAIGDDCTGEETWGLETGFVGDPCAKGGAIGCVAGLATGAGRGVAVLGRAVRFGDEQTY